MNYKILLMGLLAATLTSCSTAYQSGQTPDDVYYSPVRPDVAKKEKEDKYEDYARNDDDQFLRMKVRHRDRWSTIDDYDYWNTSNYNCACNCNSYDYNTYSYNTYNTTYAWNNWRGPRCYSYGSYGYYNNTGYYGHNGYPVYITKTPVKRPSNVNRPSLKGYNNNTYSSFGNNIKNVFSGNNNSGYNNSNSGNSGESPSRTYNPSSSSSSSSGSSSSGSSGAVSRPARNGRN